MSTAKGNGGPPGNYVVEGNVSYYIEKDEAVQDWGVTRSGKILNLNTGIQVESIYAQSKSDGSFSYGATIKKDNVELANIALASDAKEGTSIANVRDGFGNNFQQVFADNKPVPGVRINAPHIDDFHSPLGSTGNGLHDNVVLIGTFQVPSGLDLSEANALFANLDILRL